MSRRWDKASEDTPIVKQNRLKSQKQEKRLAKELGGRTVAGSGSGQNKGDVDTLMFKIEAKRTDKQSLSVQASWLTKIDDEAHSVGKYPALVLEVGGVEWVAVPKQLFKTLSGFLLDK